MKYLILVLPLCIIISFSSCSKETEKTSVVTKFNKTGELKSQVQKIPVPILLPRSMFTVDDKLFIYKEKEPQLFDIYNIPDGKYICSAGSRGSGPNDFGPLDTRSLHSSGNGFNVMEAGTNIFKTVIFKDNNLSVIKSERLFDDYVTNNGLYALEDDVYLTLGNIGELNEYCLFDKKTGDTQKIGTYPQWTSHDIDLNKDVPLFVTYLKSCAVHPDKEKFAAFYGRFKRLRIYDKSAELLHDVDVRIEPYTTTLQENVPDQFIYYTGQPHVIDEFIYALCLNSLPGNSNTGNECELHVWNWEGQPVACYKFDRKVSYMAISKEYNKIFALDTFVDDELYIYDLPLLN